MKSKSGDEACLDGKMKTVSDLIRVQQQRLMDSLPRPRSALPALYPVEVLDGSCGGSSGGGTGY